MSAPGRHSAPGRRRKPPEKKSRPWWQELVFFLLVTVLSAFLLKTFIVGVYYIPSGSMENTLQIGDRVVVDKLGYDLHEIHRGDVVVFNGEGSFTPEGGVPSTSSPNPVVRVLRGAAGLVGVAPPNEKDFIKRVIGVPGDRVICCDAQGRITVNGVPLEETDYLYPGNEPSNVPFDVIVPDGKLWVMGDHRSASADSRSRLGSPGGGFVPQDQVIGRARAVIWPPGDVRRLGVPDTFKNVPDPSPTGG